MEQMSPTVSVIITTFNRSALVLDAIKSVEQQTWTDYELIVVDDGSTDDTRVRLQPYMDRIVYVYQSNKGLSSARNTGTRAARGRWLAYLDSDDVWLPTKLEQQFKAISALGEAYGACFTNCNYKGNPNLSQSVFEIAGFRTTEGFGAVSDPIRFILRETFALCIQSLLVLRSVSDRAGGFDENVAFAEDKDFIFRISFLTSISYVSEPLVRIDRTPGISRLTEFSSQRTDQVCAWHEQVLNSMLAHPGLVDQETRKLIEAELIGMYYDWTAARIMSFDAGRLTQNMGKLRSLGETRHRILRKLLTRAGAKIQRRIRNRD
jgi:hypothetical protein